MLTEHAKRIIQVLWLSSVIITLGTNAAQPAAVFQAYQHTSAHPTLTHATTQAWGALGMQFDTGGERAFVFDPRNYTWAAYDKDGYRVAGGIANGGADYCHDVKRPCRTPTGIFRIYHKKSSDCVSSKYPLNNPGAPMPYCMFFNDGVAIHGSYTMQRSNSSHGCIRVQTKAAQWLHQYFIRYGTKVIVLDY